MFLINVCFEIYNKRDKSPCLFMIHDGPKLPHFQIIFFDFPNSKGINCTPKLCKKKCHYACSTALDYCHYFSCPWIEKTILCSWNAHALIPLVTWVLSTIQDAQCKTEESLYHKNPMSPFISSVIDHKCQKVVQKRGGKAQGVSQVCP